MYLLKAIIFLIIGGTNIHNLLHFSLITKLVSITIVKRSFSIHHLYYICNHIHMGHHFGGFKNIARLYGMKSKYTASLWLSEWLGPERVPGNQKKSQFLIIGIVVLRGITASPWLLGWLGPEKVPGNQKKFPVLDYRDHGIVRNY